MTDWSHLINRTKNITYLSFYPNSLLNLLDVVHLLIQAIKDGVLGLLADLGQPGDVLALTEFLLGKSFDGFFASLSEN